MDGEKVNNPSDLYKKGDDVDAIILSINHDEKKVSLGVKQLWDDPWPTIFTELPPGKLVKTKVLSIVDFGVFLCTCADKVEGSSRRTSSSFRRTRPARTSSRRSATRSRRRSRISTRKSDASPSRCVEAKPSRLRRRRCEAKPATRPSKAPNKKTTGGEGRAAGGTAISGSSSSSKLGAKLAPDQHRQEGCHRRGRRERRRINCLRLASSGDVRRGGGLPGAARLFVV